MTNRSGSDDQEIETRIRYGKYTKGEKKGNGRDVFMELNEEIEVSLVFPAASLLAHFPRVKQGDECCFLFSLLSLYSSLSFLSPFLSFPSPFLSLKEASACRLLLLAFLTHFLLSRSLPLSRVCLVHQRQKTRHGVSLDPIEKSLSFDRVLQSRSGVNRITMLRAYFSCITFDS